MTWFRVLLEPIFQELYLGHYFKGPHKNNTTALTNPVARKHDLREHRGISITKKVLSRLWADVNTTERNTATKCTHITFLSTHSSVSQSID